MVTEKLKVYICSCTGLDYFLFLGKTLNINNFDVRPIFLISELKYRRFSKQYGIKKLWLRLQMYIFYPILLLYKSLTCDKGSIFIITSNTFFAPYLVHPILKFRDIKLIHLLYDLYPDALEIAGLLSQNSFLSRTIGKIMSLTQQKSDATVYLGTFLRFHTEQRWGHTNISSVIDISTDVTLYTSPFKTLVDTEKIIIHYGGQLGYIHDAISIIDSIKYICQSDISNFVEFNFYVSGAQTDLLTKSLKGYPIKIITAVPSTQWRKDIVNFHIGLVSLSSGGASVCLPSKTYGMMAGGMAILAICPEWSDLASLITDLDAGWIVNNSPYTNKSELIGNDYLNRIQEKRDNNQIVIQFYNTVKKILFNRTQLEHKRYNSYKGVRRKYNIEVLSENWKQIINEIQK